MNFTEKVFIAAREAYGLSGRRTHVTVLVSLEGANISDIGPSLGQACKPVELATGDQVLSGTYLILNVTPGAVEGFSVRDGYITGVCRVNTIPNSFRIPTAAILRVSSPDSEAEGVEFLFNPDRFLKAPPKPEEPKKPTLTLVK